MAATESLVIGVDLGGTSCRVGVIGETGIVESSKLTTPQDPDQLFNELGQQVLRFTDKYPEAALGAFGVPGPVNRKVSPALVGPFPNIPAVSVEPFDISERLTAEIPELKGFPFMPLNDAEAATHAAAHDFAPSGNPDPLLYITISTGVGADVAVGYETLSYSAGLYMELGHTVLREGDGRLMTLEGLTSGPNIEKRYGVKTFSPETDAEYREKVWRQIARNLALGIEACVTVIGVTDVVIGGGIGSNHQDYLKEPLALALEQVTSLHPTGVLGAPNLYFVPQTEETVYGLKGCYFAANQRYADFAEL